MSRERASTAVAGIVLAAGASRRLPAEQPKQLLEIDGEPLVRRVTRRALAARLGQLVVVVGHEERRVREALVGLPVTAAYNPDWREGQSTSVRAGLAAIRPDAGAALYLNADQPHLTTAVIVRLVTAWIDGAALIVVPAHRGRRGSPVLIDRALFGELAQIEGDEGGRQIFPRHEGEIEEVELDAPEVLKDLDTPDDLEHLGRRRDR